MTIPPPPSSEPPPSILARLWADIRTAGWREAVLRYASHGLLLGLLALVLRLGRIDLTPLTPITMTQAAPAPASQPLAAGVAVAGAPVFGPLAAGRFTGLNRAVQPHTLIPTRGRLEVIQYTVQAGDTLFGIADRFNLRPETVLWGNYLTLKDDPHLLRPGQTLNILPVDGTYHYVTAGNTLDQIAKFYAVTPDAILSWPGNGLTSGQTEPPAGRWLVIPGGRRESQAWAVPSLPRSTRAKPADNFGQCAGGYTGILGAGTFVWPTPAHLLSGYDYTGIHLGVDLRAPEGTPVMAVDNGVVMYAGWNDWGYGNLVVLDHGNGWQSVYAHLSQWTVTCGQSVNQGDVIGQAGATGNASGAHLHFELRYQGAAVNPLGVFP